MLNRTINIQGTVKKKLNLLIFLMLTYNISAGSFFSSCQMYSLRERREIVSSLEKDTKNDR